MTVRSADERFLLSVVVPCFNEEAVIAETHRRLLAALAGGGFSFEMIEALLGRRMVERYELWRPSIEAIGGSATYPLFERLARKMQAAAS